MRPSLTFARLFVPTVAAVLCAALPGSAPGQETQITGKVHGGQGELLGGAVVAIDELSLAAATNMSGAYVLTVPAVRAHGQAVTVRVRYIGYQQVTREVTLGPGSQEQNFELKADPINLNPVVVTGLAGETERKLTTFSVGSVDAAQLKETPGVNALSGLAGKVAGVSTLQASGAPGGAPAIRLRGATSLSAGQDPLIIVDGTITRATLADINSEDIERVEVVKGAAASSFYGSDAANGVIQIFTRRGTNVADGRTVTTTRSEFGFSLRPKTIPQATEHSWLVCTDSLATATGCAKGAYWRDSNGDGIGDNDSIGVRLPEPDGIADNPYLRVYDHQGEAMTRGAFYTNYLSIGQRKGNTNYNLSFQNTKQEGIMVLLKGYSRQNVRINVDQVLTPRLDLSIGGFYGKSNNNEIVQGPGSPFFAVTFVEPDVNLFATNPDGSPYRAKIPDRVSNAANPLYYLNNTGNRTDRTRFTGTLKGRYRLANWLSAEANYNYDQEGSFNVQFQNTDYLDPNGIPTDGYLYRDERHGRTINGGATLTGVRTFGLGAGTVRNTTRAAFVYEDQIGTDFNLNASTVKVSGTPEFPATTGLVASSNDLTIRNRNFYGVTNFTINDRYILDGLVRRDGSSLFGSQSRYQTYYRVSGAWRVSQDLRINGVDEMKLHASYGTAGLRPRFNAQYEAYNFSGQSLRPTTLGNPLLKPARSGELEVGLNLDFLSRFTLEYSYSRKTTKDQIILKDLSAAAGGFLNQWTNAGTLLGNTHEITLGTILAERPAFSCRLNIAGDHSRQKITQWPLAPRFVGPGYSGTGIFKLAAGEVYGVMYGTHVIRNIDELYDDPTKNPLTGPYARDSVLVNEEGYVVTKAGYGTIDERPIAYVAPNGQAVVKIGDANPDFTLSFTSTLRWKNVSVYGLVNWVHGGNIYNGTRQWPFFENRDRVYDPGAKKDTANGGVPLVPGREANKKPQQYYNFFYNSINAIDYFVENGTYLKIKELNVSYTFGESTVQRLGIGAIQSLRIGVIGRNLFTFTKYSGYDPEVAGLSGDPYSFRFDVFSYPNFRTFTGFMEINF